MGADENNIPKKTPVVPAKNPEVGIKPDCRGGTPEGYRKPSQPESKLALYHLSESLIDKIDIAAKQPGGVSQFLSR